jgi:hypothetical protein
VPELLSRRREVGIVLSTHSHLSFHSPVRPSYSVRHTPRPRLSRFAPCSSRGRRRRAAPELTGSGCDRIVPNLPPGAHASRRAPTGSARRASLSASAAYAETAWRHPLCIGPMAKPPNGPPRVTREEYPYSLDRQTEHVFLQELVKVLEIALWRAAEIEECVAEIRTDGAVAVRQVAKPYWGKAVSGETRLFGSVEAFLSAWARASLIIFPNRKNDERDQARGRHVRAVLRIREPWSAFSAKDRDLRNGWMHLDEDLGSWSEQRAGDISASAVGGGSGREWYQLARGGAVRIVDVEHVAVALPLRGVWSLRPYFHECKELLEQALRAVRDADIRWHCVDGVCGIIVCWAGFGRSPAEWMIKSLSLREPFTVSAQTRQELIQQFAYAVAHWRAEAG